jgi:hypothetical protein
MPPIGHSGPVVHFSIVMQAGSRESEVALVEAKENSSLDFQCRPREWAGRRDLQFLHTPGRLPAVARTQFPISGMISDHQYFPGFGFAGPDLLALDWGVGLGRLTCN